MPLDKFALVLFLWRVILRHIPYVPQTTAGIVKTDPRTHLLLKLSFFLRLPLFRPPLLLPEISSQNKLSAYNLLDILLSKGTQINTYPKASERFFKIINIYRTYASYDI